MRKKDFKNSTLLIIFLTISAFSINAKSSTDYEVHLTQYSNNLKELNYTPLEESDFTNGSQELCMTSQLTCYNIDKNSFDNWTLDVQDHLKILSIGKNKLLVNGHEKYLNYERVHPYTSATINHQQQKNFFNIYSNF